MTRTATPRKPDRRAPDMVGTPVPRGRAQTPPDPDSEAPLFLGSRLMTLVNLMRRITASRFQRSYDLSLVEGWIILRLGPNAPLTLDSLAHRNGLEKSQMSRSVSGLVARGLVDRRRNALNASALELDLTKAGRHIYEEMIRRAPEYNAWLAAGLDPGEITALTGFVDRLIENSRRNLAVELARTDRAP